MSENRHKYTKISWDYSGIPDVTCGTGATWQERGLVYGGGTLLTIVLCLTHLNYFQMDYTVLQWILFIAISFDILAGAIANMLNSCKRFYHSPLKEEETGLIKLLKNKYFFVSIHMHPILIAFFFDVSLHTALIWYGLILFAALIILMTPLYLKRPMAAYFCLAIFLGSFYFLPLPFEWQWFIPCFAFKLLMGHMVREEPYRPLKD